MARFACISLPYRGHIEPMAAVARALVARGHSVVFVHLAEMAPRVQSLDFVAVGSATHPPGWLAQAERHLGQVHGCLNLGSAIRDFASLTAMLCETLPDVLKDLSVDLVLTDQMEAAGGMVAYRLGLPFISVAAALPLNWETGIPSPFVGWSYGTNAWHRCRNSASAFAARRLRKPIDNVIGDLADRWRLGAGRRIEDYMSGFAQISQLVPSLDYPRRSVIGCFHYCGPLRDRRRTAPASRTPTGRAFASLGTLQGHRADIFDTIAAAAASMGLDLTIAHGGRLAGDDLRRLSRWAKVLDFVRQDEVLAESDIAILHGGLNTVLDALAQAVPIVAIPLAFEQGAIAARLERSGAGIACRARWFDQRVLAARMRTVLGEPSHATAATRIQAEIETSGGVDRAADIVEYVARTGRPYLNDNAVAGVVSASEGAGGFQPAPA